MKNLQKICKGKYQLICENTGEELPFYVFKRKDGKWVGLDYDCEIEITHPCKTIKECLIYMPSCWWD